MYDYCSDTYCLNFSVDEDDNITSLSESEASKLIVSTFPVPAKDRVEFNISNGKSDMTLRFYNATGKMVKEVNKVSGQNPEIEIPELIDGMYMYSLSNAEGVLNQGKIIVIK